MSVAYAVVVGSYDEYRVSSIWTTIEKAEEAVEIHRQRGPGYNNPRIEVYPLDDPAANQATDVEYGYRVTYDFGKHGFDIDNLEKNSEISRVWIPEWETSEVEFSGETTLSCDESNEKLAISRIAFALGELFIQEMKKA